MMVECGMFVYARYVYQYSDDEALKNLMKAMYHYNNAAIEYFYFFSVRCKIKLQKVVNT